jgi:hypothetical protein
MVAPACAPSYGRSPLAFSYRLFHTNLRVLALETSHFSVLVLGVIGACLRLRISGYVDRAI